MSTENLLTDPTGEKHAARKAEQAAELRDFEKRRALRNITQSAITLKRYIESVKVDAERALNAMNDGKMAFGVYSGGFGPIGHQAPFDIAVASQKLVSAIDTAMILEINEAEIQTAYLAGVKAAS